MPSLQCFGRRWHVASDSLPAFSAVLATFHLLWFIAFWLGAWSLESGSSGMKSDCDEQQLLRVVCYGTICLLTLGLLLECSITGVGLQGGPLESSKRRAMAPLLYAKVALWTAFLGFTIFSTYVISSPQVPDTCWDVNPCLYHGDLHSCGYMNGSDVPTLSPACEQVFTNMDEFGVCLMGWFLLGVHWQHTGETCYAGWRADALAVLDAPDTGGDSAPIDFQNNTAGFLSALGLSYDPNAVTASAPWFGCQAAECATLLRATDSCSDWVVLQNIVIPPRSSKRSFFEAMIYSSWGVLALTALVAYMAHNSFPDYNDVESWEGTLKGLAGACCCGDQLEAATGREGDTASREIATSLHQLFGGIDLDPSDRLLGVYLVVEEQHRWRQRQALQALEAACVTKKLAPAGPLMRSWRRIAGAAKSLTSGQPSEGGAAATATAAACQATGSRSTLPAAAHAAVNERPGSVESSPTASEAHAALPSPMEGQSSGGSSEASAEGGAAPAHLPCYRHTFLRLRSSGDGATVAGGKPGAAKPRGLAGSSLQVAEAYVPLVTPTGCVGQLHITPQEAARLYTGHHEPVPPPVLREAQRYCTFAGVAYGLQIVLWGKGKKLPMCMGNASALARCLGRPFKVESKFRARNFRAIVDICGVAPSDLLYVSYANAPGGVVPHMLMLHRPSKSVVLSVRGTVSMEDMITDLLSKPTDVRGWMPDWVEAACNDGEPMYAHAGIVGSATGILRDLEERGLLDDLLFAQLCQKSSTVSDGSGAAEAISPEPSSSNQPGAGQRGRLAARLQTWHRERGTAVDRAPSELIAGPAQGGPGTGSALGGDAEALPDLSRLREGAEVRLPLQRAHTLLRGRLRSDGWKVVVTGHSLGAAVACLLSFHLRDSFPDLRCWAFNPPGGLLSWNLSRVAQSFCTSVVVGKDLISRLSFSTSKRLVDEMVTCLARCKRPKLLVLADILVKRRRQPDYDFLTFCRLEDMAPEAVQALEGYYRSSQLYAGGQVEMFPPGRLVFMRPFKGRRPEQAVWDAVWVEAPALIGEGILVSPAMMSHHRMFTLEDAFRSVFAGETAATKGAVSPVPLPLPEEQEEEEERMV